MIKKFLCLCCILSFILPASSICFAGTRELCLEGTKAFRYNDSITFIVYSAETGDYSAEIVSEKFDGMGVEVNGQSGLCTGKEFDLSLRRGINTVCFTSGEVDALVIKDIAMTNDYGATLPVITYEAEESFDGLISDRSREYGSMSSEASGRRYVSLTNMGDYVSFKLTEPTNALVLRCSIPDSTDGKGIAATLGVFADGEALPSFKLTSRYSWSYGEFPWTNNPSDGNAHQFFDDARLMLDKVYPSGTVITLMRGENDTADFYCIDFLETEFVEPPLEQPEGSLSVLDFGAVPNDDGDDTEFFDNCIREAGKEDKPVWIPPGEYILDSGVYPHGIDIRTSVTIMGAGMWHTTLKGTAAAFYLRSGHITMRDFSLVGDCVIRDDNLYPSALESDINRLNIEDLRLYNLWIEHQKVGIWFNTVKSVHIAGCRIRNTYADGINLRKASSYCIIEQNDFRSTGDDAIAGWSAVANNTGNIIRANSIALPWLANGIALYGGADIEITNNLVRDTVAFGAGINISTNFNPASFNGTILIEDNYVLRCGSVGYSADELHGAIWFNTVEGTKNEADVIVKNNIVEDSTFYGVSFSGSGEITGAAILNNSFNGAKYSVVYVAPGAFGKASFNNNTCTDIPFGEVMNKGNINISE